jgi:hypothetical protein
VPVFGKTGPHDEPDVSRAHHRNFHERMLPRTVSPSRLRIKPCGGAKKPCSVLLALCAVNPLNNKNFYLLRLAKTATPRLSARRYVSEA